MELLWKTVSQCKLLTTCLPVGARHITALPCATLAIRHALCKVWHCDVAKSQKLRLIYWWGISGTPGSVFCVTLGFYQLSHFVFAQKYNMLKHPIVHDMTSKYCKGVIHCVFMVKKPMVMLTKLELSSIDINDSEDNWGQGSWAIKEQNTY